MTRVPCRPRSGTLWEDVLMNVIAGIEAPVRKEIPKGEEIEGNDGGSHVFQTLT